VKLWLSTFARRDSTVPDKNSDTASAPEPTTEKKTKR
jgi:hypothetical protein